ADRPSRGARSRCRGARRAFARGPPRRRESAREGAASPGTVGRSAALGKTLVLSCARGSCAQLPRWKAPAEEPTMIVERIMTRDVACCSPNDTLDRAVKLMADYDCGCVPVVEGGAIAGILTDRDACMA